MTETDRAALHATLMARTPAWKAMLEGGRLSIRTAPVSVPAAIVFGLVQAAVFVGAQRVGTAVQALDAGAREALQDVALFPAAVLAVYTFVQVLKRKTASRSSWVPTLLALPAWLVWGALVAADSEVAGGLPLNMPAALWYFAAIFIAIGWLQPLRSIAWLSAARDVTDRQRPSLARSLAETRTRGLRVMPVIGGGNTAISAGLQLLFFPGVLFALQLAFLDAVAVIKPDQPAWRRSTRLTSGMRSRIARLYALWLVGSFILQGALALVWVSPDDVVEHLMMWQTDVSMFSWQVWALSSMVFSLWALILHLGCYVLYVEREAQVRAKVALRELEGAA